MQALDSQLSQLENAQLVRRVIEEDLAYLFKHALTQESAYHSLLVKKRGELHRHVAQAYEQLYPQRLDELAGLLAYHYSQAGDNVKRFEYALRAGDVAKRLSAYTEARSHYDTALNALGHLPDTEQNRRARVDATLKQVTVAWGLDTFEQNLARLVEAEALAKTLPQGDQFYLARVRYWIGRVYSYGNQHLKAFRYYEQMKAASPEANDQELGLASALGARTRHLQGYFAKSVPLFQKSLEQWKNLNDWQEWILDKAMLAISLAAQGQSEQGRRHGEEAVERALTLKDRGSLAIAYLMSSRVEFMAGDVQRMLDVISVWVKEAEATYPLVHYMTLGFQAWAESRLGMHERARATMKAMDELASKLGARLIFADWFAAARAEIELNAGQVDEALRLAEIAIDEARAAGGIFSEGIAQRVWGQALAAQRQNDREAETHFQKSLELFEEGDAVIEAARTHLAWARFLHERGESNAAREHFERAASQFQALGLNRELEETRDLLAVSSH